MSGLQTSLVLGRALEHRSHISEATTHWPAPIGVVDVLRDLVTPVIRIQSSDPDEFDRLAAALTATADSLRAAALEVSR
jgi:hypothetical protein